MGFAIDYCLIKLVPAVFIPLGLAGLIEALGSLDFFKIYSR